MCDGGTSEERESQYDYTERNVSQVAGNAKPQREKRYRRSASPRSAAGRWFPLLLTPLRAACPSSATAAQREPVSEPWHRADAVRNAGTVSLQLTPGTGAGGVFPFRGWCRPAARLCLSSPPGRATENQARLHPPPGRLPAVQLH